MSIIPSAAPNNTNPSALSPEREAEIREWEAELGSGKSTAGVGPYTALRDTLAELDRVRAELADRQEDIALLHRNTLPELRRESQHHEDGKKRWRDRAEKAEAALATKPAEALAEAADRLALELTAEGASLSGYPLAIRSAVRNLRAMADEAATGGAA